MESQVLGRMRNRSKVSAISCVAHGMWHSEPSRPHLDRFEFAEWATSPIQEEGVSNIRAPERLWEHPVGRAHIHQSGAFHRHAGFTFSAACRRAVTASTCSRLSGGCPDTPRRGSR